MFFDTLQLSVITSLPNLVTELYFLKIINKKDVAILKINSLIWLNFGCQNRDDDFGCLQFAVKANIDYMQVCITAYKL